MMNHLDRGLHIDPRTLFTQMASPFSLKPPVLCFGWGRAGGVPHGSCSADGVRMTPLNAASNTTPNRVIQRIIDITVIVAFITITDL